MTRFVCTPDMLRELVFGLLLSCGMISAPEDVYDLTLAGEQALVRLKAELPRREPLELPLEPLYAAEHLLWCGENAAGQGELFARTGGAHYGGIYIERRLCSFAEDISRKNALAKAMGGALLSGIMLREACLVTSGRVSEEIVMMAVYAGIPMLISRAAPTDRAVEAALWYRLTLCGFVRGDRMNCYAGESRLGGTLNRSLSFTAN